MKRSIVAAIACACALAMFADARPAVAITATRKKDRGISVRKQHKTAFSY